MKTETNSKIGRLNLRFEVENYIQKFNLFYLVRVLLKLAGSKKNFFRGIVFSVFHFSSALNSVQN